MQADTENRMFRHPTKICRNDDIQLSGPALAKCLPLCAAEPVSESLRPWLGFVSGPLAFC